MIATRDEYLRLNPALHPGIDVRSQDGEKLGEIASLENDFFVIEKGFFFPKKFTARYDDIATVVGGEARLRLTNDELRPWREQDYEGWGAVDRGDSSFEATRTFDVDEVRMPVVEEELEAQTSERQTGEVRLRKVVHTELKHLTVPVTREEVVVERVPADGRTPSKADFRDETIVVPIHEEQVEVVKKPVVREEVRVHKETHTEQQPVEGEVRREEVIVDDETRRTPKAS